MSAVHYSFTVQYRSHNDGCVKTRSRAHPLNTSGMLHRIRYTMGKYVTPRGDFVAFLWRRGGILNADIKRRAQCRNRKPRRSSNLRSFFAYCQLLPVVLFLALFIIVISPRTRKEPYLSSSPKCMEMWMYGHCSPYTLHFPHALGKHVIRNLIYPASAK